MVIHNIDLASTCYRVSIKALIRDEQDKILLLHERKLGWELPGGGLDHGESIQEGLAREVKEELGVELQEFTDKPYAVWVEDLTEVHGVYALFLLYSVTVDSHNFVFNDTQEDFLDFGFFTPQEIKTMDLHRNIKRLPEFVF